MPPQHRAALTNTALHLTLCVYDIHYTHNGIYIWTTAAHNTPQLAHFHSIDWLAKLKRFSSSTFCPFYEMSLGFCLLLLLKNFLVATTAWRCAGCIPSIFLLLNFFRQIIRRFSTILLRNILRVVNYLAHWASRYIVQCIVVFRK